MSGNGQKTRHITWITQGGGQSLVHLRESPVFGGLHNNRHSLRWRAAETLALCEERAVRIPVRVEDNVPRNTSEISHKLGRPQNRGGHDFLDCEEDITSNVRASYELVQGTLLNDN